MFQNPKEQFAAWTKPSEDIFKFWISLFPVAPLFGVTWRFDPTSGMTATFTGAAKPAETASKPAKAAKPAKKAKAAPVPAVVEAPAEAVAEAAETVAAATVEAMVEAVETVTEAAEAITETLTDAAPEAPAEATAGQPASLMAEAPAEPDDLKLIKGVGPALERQLNGLGVYTFAQIAAFSEADLQWVDDNLTAFKGRCFRDDWIGQAREKLA